MVAVLPNAGRTKMIHGLREKAAEHFSAPIFLPPQRTTGIFLSSIFLAQPALEYNDLHTVISADDRIFLP